MAAPYNPPVKGEDFIIYIALSDALDPKSFRVNPTIAEGDFKVSKDGQSLANLTSLPVNSPAGSVLVCIALTAAEMNGNNVTIVGIDQTATKEWADFVLSIPTTA